MSLEASCEELYKAAINYLQPAAHVYYDIASGLGGALSDRKHNGTDAAINKFAKDQKETNKDSEQSTEENYEDAYDTKLPGKRDASGIGSLDSKWGEVINAAQGVFNDAGSNIYDASILLRYIAYAYADGDDKAEAAIRKAGGLEEDMPLPSGRKD